MTLTHYLAMQGEDAIITHTNDYVFIATVERVENKNGSNGNPPKVQLLLEETLRGNPLPPTLNTAWPPFPHDVDWVGEGAEERIEKWAQRPLIGPDEGETYIFVGSAYQNSFHLSPIGCFPYSPEKLAWAKAAIEKGRKIKAELEEEQRQTKEMEEKRLQNWKEKLDKADLQSLSQKAGFIATGRVMTEIIPGKSMRFEIEKILKGIPPESAAKQYEDGKYFLEIRNIPGEAHFALYQSRAVPTNFPKSFLFFLNLDYTPPPNVYGIDRYRLIDNDYSIHPATAEKIAAIQEHLKNE